MNELVKDCKFLCMRQMHNARAYSTIASINSTWLMQGSEIPDNAKSLVDK